MSTDNYSHAEIFYAIKENWHIVAAMCMTSWYFLGHIRKYLFNNYVTVEKMEAAMENLGADLKGRIDQSDSANETRYKEIVALLFEHINRGN